MGSKHRGFLPRHADLVIYPWLGHKTICLISPVALIKVSLAGLDWVELRCIDGGRVSTHSGCSKKKGKRRLYTFVPKRNEFPTLRVGTRLDCLGATR